jgi:hypothetical protein
MRNRLGGKEVWQREQARDQRREQDCRRLPPREKQHEVR